MLLEREKINCHTMLLKYFIQSKVHKSFNLIKGAKIIPGQTNGSCYPITLPEVDDDNEPQQWAS